MLEGARVAVVVPACDEERWIAEVIATLPAFVDHAIVVDDRSGDATVACALRAGESRSGGPRVEVVRHGENRGVGAAVVTGYRRARALGCDVVAVMAGDGQMHPDDLAGVVLPVARGDADYVKGDRTRHPDVWRLMPLPRLLAGIALARLTRLAAALDTLSDSQCGFTAISAAAIAALDLDALYPRYGYPNDLLGALARAGLRIREVVVRPVYRGEASGIRPWHLAVIGGLIGRIALRRLADAVTVHDGAVVERGAHRTGRTARSPSRVPSARAAAPLPHQDHGREQQPAPPPPHAAAAASRAPRSPSGARPAAPAHRELGE